MVKTVEEAKAYRKQFETLTAYAPAEMAVKTPTAYPVWSPDSVQYYGPDSPEHPQSKVRASLEDPTLYKALKDHVSQELWRPGIETASLWTVIDEEHAGTLEDPIPAKRNMEYFNGKYYLDPEDGKIYRCTRDSEIALAYLPHELIGHYFVTV